MLAQAREMPSRTREATAGGRRGSWLTAAGFVDPRMVPLPGPTDLMVAAMPAAGP